MVEGNWALVIIPFSHSDAPYAELANIHQTCFKAGWDEDTFDALLCGFGTKGLYLQNDLGAIEGFVLYRQPFDDAEILTICIKSKQKGFGTKLMDAMLNALHKPGKCFLEVSPTNEAALKLYQKFSFETVYIRKDYYEAGEDAYMMMREF